MTPTVRLILASESPRRRELLSTVGVPFRVIPSGVDETPRRGEPPARFARRAARDKGLWVAKRHPDAYVLSADTIVVRDGRILGKPRDRADARRMLSLLAGREHRVYTAVSLLCAAKGHEETAVEVSRVRFRTLSPAEVAGYARTGEGDDKAGAYAAQGAGMLLIDRVAGSFSNVVGLPMTRVVAMLASARLIRVSPSGPSWYGPARGRG